MEDSRKCIVFQELFMNVTHIKELPYASILGKIIIEYLNRFHKKKRIPHSLWKDEETTAIKKSKTRHLEPLGTLQLYKLEA